MERTALIVLGLYWLITIRFAAGVMAIRWTLVIGFLVIGIATTVGYLRARRS